MDDAGDRRDLVMFDYDGVVVDSLDVFIPSFIEASRQAGIEGVTTEEDAIALFEGNFYDALRALGAGEAQITRAFDRTGDALMLAAPWLKPFPLIREVIEELSTARTVIIVTSNKTRVVEGWLGRHGVSGVTEVAGAEAAQSKIEKIRRLVERFPGQEVYWYVGDTAGDMIEARAAGVTPLGVAWGWHDPEKLVNAGAERVAAAPAELLTIVAPELTHDFFTG